MMEVRAAALQRFGVGALAAGEPVANLRRKFVPIWLLHRYQVEAAAKLIGGVDFSYSVRGDGRESARPVPAADQRARARRPVGHAEAGGADGAGAPAAGDVRRLVGQQRPPI